MKTMKKLVSMVMILAMIFSMSTVAFAEESFDLAITNAKDGHVYGAYQLFTGTVSGGKLVDVDWGEGVNGTDLLNELDDEEPYSNCESAADVAKVLDDFTDKSEDLDAFAKIAGKHLKNASKTVSIKTAGNNYVFKDLKAGYYLVKDENKPSDSQDAYTKYILSVVKVTANITITAKGDYPSLDKFIEISKVGEGTVETVKYTDVSVGDVVSYVVKSDVPDMDGYTNYDYVVTDTMSKGLTFLDNVKVTIAGEELADDVYEVETETVGDNTVITITFDNFIQYKEQSGAPVEIKYTARVNGNATIGNEGNLNTAKLTFSNNPYNEEDNGETPGSDTRVYTTAIQLTKVDGNDNNIKLTGAKFKISGGDLTEYEAEVDNNGVLKIEGIGAGTYTIEETQAPVGYNKLKEPITVVVKFVGLREGSTDCMWSFNSSDASAGIYTFEVENFTGLTLPSTGGMGTTLFYVVGAILLIGAGVLIISKKRMANK